MSHDIEGKYFNFSRIMSKNANFPTLGPKGPQKPPKFTYNPKCWQHISNKICTFPQQKSTKLHIFLDRSQSLFNFVPQEKRLIWRPPLGWKNMGESIFHWENWPYDSQKRPKVGGNMPWVAGNWSEFFFVHYSGRRSHFSAGGMQIVLNQVFVVYFLQ